MNHHDNHLKRHIISVHQGKKPLIVTHGILVLLKIKDWLVMLVLFMKLKVHLKKCFHNVYKEMAWDVTFVTKNCEKVIVNIVETISRIPNLSKHIINKHDWHKFVVTNISSQSITLWTLWKHFFKFYKFWNLSASRTYN